jgi:hypothetical protein
MGIAVPKKLPASAAERECEALVPKRLFKGTLNLDIMKDKVGEKELRWYHDLESKDPEFHKKTIEVLNFMDGGRSVREIVTAVSAEYSPTKHEHILRFLRDLERSKLVKIGKGRKG